MSSSASTTGPPCAPPAPDTLDWTACETQFARRRLHFGDGTASVRFPATAKVVATGMSLFGIVWLIMAIKLLIDDPSGSAGWIVGLLGATTAMLPIVLFRMTKMLSFECGQDRYHTPQRGIDPVGRRHVQGRLADVVALQLLDKVIATTKDTDQDGFSDTATTFRAFELNLVINDGRRIHVLDDDDLWVIARSAQKLATMLGVPLWRKPGMRYLD